MSITIRVSRSYEQFISFYIPSMWETICQASASYSGINLCSKIPVFWPGLGALTFDYPRIPPPPPVSPRIPSRCSDVFGNKFGNKCVRAMLIGQENYEETRRYFRQMPTACFPTVRTFIANKWECVWGKGNSTEGRLGLGPVQGHPPMERQKWLET